jgi:hypothetical protein
VGRSDGRAAAEFALDGELEAIVAESTLLLHVGTDLFDLLLRQNLIEQGTVSALTLIV